MEITGKMDPYPRAVIRFARWDDMDAIRAILDREFGAKPKEVRTWVAGVEAVLSTMLVAVDGTAVVGFGGVQFVQPPLVFFVSDCVDISHRGKGFGAALVLARIAMFDHEEEPLDAGLLALERNLSFYAKFGFVADGSVIRDPALGWSFYRMERVIVAADSRNAAAELQKRGICLELENAVE